MLNRALVVLVCLAGPAAPAAAAHGSWWRDPAVQRRLSLTTLQVSAIETVHANSLEQRQALRHALDRADRALEIGLVKSTSEADLVALIDRAEECRKRRNVARTMLLVRIYRILTALQRQQLARLGLQPPLHLK